MNIRRAQNKDADKILELLNQVLELHAHIRPDIFVSGTTKYSREELLEIIADDNRPIFVAADEKDDVMGYCFCVLMEQPKREYMVPFKTIYIDDLCVDKHYRGRQVGTALFDFVNATLLLFNQPSKSNIFLALKSLTTVSTSFVKV